MSWLDKDGVIYLWSKVKGLFNKGITALSVSGRTITYTKGDGTTGTITTQDTNTTYGVVSKSANGLAPKLPNETATTKYLRQDGTWAVPPDNNTTYSDMKGATTSAAGTHGLAPAPAAGAANRYLRSDGTWSVPPDNNTTYSDMKGATTSAAGTHGLAPAPAAGAANRYLRSDGTWSVPPDNNTTYSVFHGANLTDSGAAGLVPAPTSGPVNRYLSSGGTWEMPALATKSSPGLMDSSDKSKLDGVATGANNYSHPTGPGYNHIPSGGGSGQILRYSSSGVAVWGAEKDTTYSAFKGATASAAGTGGLVPAPAKGADKYVLAGDGSWRYFIASEQAATSGILLSLETNAGELVNWQLDPASGNSAGIMSVAMYQKLSDLPSASSIANTYAKKSDIVGMYKYKGSVADASKLPTSGQTTGDVYNIETASVYGAAGANVAWNGSAWDSLGEIFQISRITNSELDTICV